MRILVVEDELDLNHIICNKLTKEGYNVDAMPVLTVRQHLIIWRRQVMMEL